MSGAGDFSNRAIDASQAEIGKAGAGTADVRVFIITNEIKVHNRQTPRDINLSANRQQFTQADSDEYP